MTTHATAQITWLQVAPKRCRSLIHSGVFYIQTPPPKCRVIITKYRLTARCLMLHPKTTGQKTEEKKEQEKILREETTKTEKHAQVSAEKIKAQDEGAKHHEKTIISETNKQNRKKQ